jgi:glutathione S-transferase
VAISLAEKNVKHKRTVIDLQAKPADFISLYKSACMDPDMSAKVPLLVTDDEDGLPPLIESMVILDWMEEEYPSSGPFSESAAARARARLFASLGPGWMSTMAVLRSEAGSEEEAQAVSKLRANLKAMDAFLRETKRGDGGGVGAHEEPYLLGADFSYAECATAPFAQRLKYLLPGLRPNLGRVEAWLEADGCTHMAAWLEAVCSRPSCVDSLPPPSELIESWARLLERMKSAAAPR